MFGDPTYPSYQVFIAIGISALLCAVLMPAFIRLMRYEGFGQQVRADGPKRHLIKQGTPTMGGVVILLSIVVTCLVQTALTPRLVLALGTTLLCACLGLADDLRSTQPMLATCRLLSIFLAAFLLI